MNSNTYLACSVVFCLTALSLTTLWAAKVDRIKSEYLINCAVIFQDKDKCKQIFEAKE